MGFTTYKNVANPHVTIHRDGCNQIKKHGGQHQEDEKDRWDQASIIRY
jgi:hypothetical protein